MKLEREWIEGHKIEPLVMEKLLKDRMFLNEGRDPIRRSFNHAKESHRFMIMDVAVVLRLQGKSALRITSAAQLYPEPDTTLRITLFPLP